MSQLNLDHIIILLPHTDLLNPPPSLTTHFTLTPGGRHADDKTENKLILFQDGSYIELISFVHDDPARKQHHWWGDKEPGVIDFALTSTTAEENYELVQDRLQQDQKSISGLRVKYEPPVAGGRTQSNGEEIKWQVTFPSSGTERGQIPFFCHDVTPRHHRVPISNENTSHPCGAYGVKSLTVCVPPERWVELSRVYASILGRSVGRGGDGSGDGGGPADDDNDKDISTFEVGRVHDIQNAALPQIHLRPATSGQDLQKGVVLGDIVLGGTRDGSGDETQSGSRRSTIDDGLALGNMVVEYY